MPRPTRPAPHAVAAAAIVLFLGGAAPTTAPAPATSLSLDLGKGLAWTWSACRPGRSRWGRPDAEGDRRPDRGAAAQGDVRQAVLDRQVRGHPGPVGGPGRPEPEPVPARPRLGTAAVRVCQLDRLPEVLRRRHQGHGQVGPPAERGRVGVCRPRRAARGTFGSVGNGLSSAHGELQRHQPVRRGPRPAPNRQKTVAVGSFPANGFGLCDTAGNVSEWCQDVYRDGYDGAPTDGSARRDGRQPGAAGLPRRGVQQRRQQLPVRRPLRGRAEGEPQRHARVPRRRRGLTRRPEVRAGPCRPRPARHALALGPACPAPGPAPPSRIRPAPGQPAAGSTSPTASQPKADAHTGSSVYSTAARAAGRCRWPVACSHVVAAVVTRPRYRTAAHG